MYRKPITDADAWCVRQGQRVRATGRGAQSSAFDGLAADLVHALFSVDPKLTGAEPRAQRALVEGLMGLEAYSMLRRSTMLRHAEALLAASAILERFVERLKQPAADNQEGAEPSAGMPGDDGTVSSGGQAQSAANNAGNTLMDDIDAAVAQAKEDQAAYDTLERACHPDGQHSADPEELVPQFIQELAHSRELRTMLALAGRLVRYSAGQRTMGTSRGSGVRSGLRLTNDARHAVPAQLAWLGDVDLEDEFLRRMLEGTLLGYEHRAMQPRGYGPLLVTIDESGSMEERHTMDGKRMQAVTIARALALAMVWLAGVQRRHITIVAHWAEGGAAMRRVLDIPPYRTTRVEEEVLRFFHDFVGGGTGADIPPLWLPDVQLPSGAVDVICITDHLWGRNITAPVVKRVRQWCRKNNVRIFFLPVGAHDSDMAQAEQWADYTAPDATRGVYAVLNALSAVGVKRNKCGG